MPANFVSGITINELYNPPAEPGPDYNGDGKSDSGDLFIELYNANPTDVNLDGWEIWVNDERQMRFTSDHTIAADGRFVVVSPVAGTAHPIQNVVGPAVYADDWMLFGRTSVISLYDPGANAFFMVAGRWSGSYDLYADAIQAAHPGAEWIGNDPEWGFGKVEFFGDLDNFAGYSFQRVTDGADDLTSIRLANPGAPNCFAPGTMIATPLGEV
ncbi:MAG: lamin tail domain-containing protein, partial [Pseudomonadota bacterium]